MLYLWYKYKLYTEYIYPLFLFTRLLLFFNITMNHVVKLYVIMLMSFFFLTLLCVLSFCVIYDRVYN